MDKMPLMLSAVTLLVTSTLALCQTADEPRALTNARQGYEAEARQALQPVNTRYLQKLDKLKRDYLESNDSAAAAAVVKEIAAVKAATSTHAVKDWVSGTYWLRDGTSHTRRFEKGKCTALDTANGQKWTAKYKIVSDTEVKIRRDDNGVEDTYMLLPDKTLQIEGGVYRKSAR